MAEAEEKPLREQYIDALWEKYSHDDITAEVSASIVEDFADAQMKIDRQRIEIDRLKDRVRQQEEELKAYL